MKGPESKPYEKWPGLFILGKGRFRGDLTAFDKYLKGGGTEVGLGLFSQVASHGPGGNGLGEVQIGHWEEFPHGMGC